MQPSLVFAPDDPNAQLTYARAVTAAAPDAALVGTGLGRESDPAVPAPADTSDGVERSEPVGAGGGARVACAMSVSTAASNALSAKFSSRCACSTDRIRY